MTIPRIYSSESLQNKESCRLAEDNLKYIKTVLRLKPGDEISVFDGFGNEFKGTISTFSPQGVEVKLGKRIPREDKKISITLAQAIPKAAKMDFIVKNAAELGVDLIIPFTAHRSISRIAGDNAAQKIKRWQKIAAEAARCSRSSFLAKIAPVSSYQEMLKHAENKHVKMIFWEEEEKNSIRAALGDKKLDTLRDFFIIVGPEGGFSREEIAAANQAGFQSVSLGKHILKVETAATVIISILHYEKGIFSSH